MSRGRSNSGQKSKVEEARRIVRAELGAAVRDDAPRNDARFVPVAPPPLPVKSEAVPVLLIAEAATLLGITTEAMEAMVDAGKVRTLSVGHWTTVIPASEVERLRNSVELEF